MDAFGFRRTGMYADAYPAAWRKSDAVVLPDCLCPRLADARFETKCLPQPDAGISKRSSENFSDDLKHTIQRLFHFSATDSSNKESA